MKLPIKSEHDTLTVVLPEGKGDDGVQLMIALDIIFGVTEIPLTSITTLDGSIPMSVVTEIDIVERFDAAKEGVGAGLLKIGALPHAVPQKTSNDIKSRQLKRQARSSVVISWG